MTIAAEGKAKTISSSAFVRKYRLISASSAASAVKEAIRKGLYHFR